MDGSGFKHSEKLVKNPSEEIESLLAQEQAPKAWLWWGSLHEDWRVRQVVAQNPAAPAGALRVLVAAENWCISNMAASDAATLRSHLGLLREMQAAKQRVFESVAKNPNTPLPVLWDLVRREPKKAIAKAVLSNPALRVTVAAAPNALREAPVEALRALFAQKDVPKAWLQWGSRHEDQHIRLTIAESPATPTSVLSTLSVDKDPRVRTAAAENPNMSENFIHLLCRAGANRTLEWVSPTSAPLTASERQRLLRSGPFGRQLVAAHPETLPKALRILAEDENEAVRRAVASHDSTPVEALCMLAEDNNWRIRTAIASHVSTPNEVLHTLSEDDQPWVRQAAASRLSTLQKNTEQQVCHSLYG